MKKAQLARRAFMVAAGATAVTLALTGCNASGGGADASGVATLKLIMNPGPEADAMSKVMAAYNSGPGAGDKIHVTVDQLSRTDTYAREATLMSTKSSDYDFYQTAIYYIAQHSQYLAPLSLNDSQYFKSSLGSLNVQGKQYGIPLDPSVHMVFYRTDLIGSMLNDKATFEKISQQVLGKTLEPKSPDQWTWDDYIASAAYFTQQYKPGIADEVRHGAAGEEPGLQRDGLGRRPLQQRRQLAGLLGKAEPRQPGGGRRREHLPDDLHQGSDLAGLRPG